MSMKDFKSETNRLAADILALLAVRAKNVPHGVVMAALDMAEISIILGYAKNNIGHDSSIRELLTRTADVKINMIKDMGYDVDAKKAGMK